MARVQLSLLGAAEIRSDESVLRADAPLLFALVLYLSAANGRPVPRDELTSLLFAGDNDPRLSSHNLRQLLYRARRIGVPFFLTNTSAALSPNDIHSDVDAFVQSSYTERLADRRTSYLILPHYCPVQPRPLAMWVEDYRDRLHQALRRVFSDDLARARQSADWQSVELISRRLLTIDELNESATLSLAEAIARTGAKVSALALLARYQRDVGTSELTLPAALLSKRITRLPLEEPGRTTFHFAGRAEETRVLMERWRHASSGVLTTMLLTGEKSIGKSRLLEEFARLILLNGSGNVLIHRATATDHARPMALFADLSHKLLALPGAAGCNPALLPILHTLSNTRARGSPLSSEHDRAAYDDANVREAICDLLTSVTDERATAILIDDGRALDSASASVLTHIATRIPRCRLLVAAAATDDPTRSDATWLTTRPDLCVLPLSNKACEELARSLAATSIPPLDDEDIKWCLDNAGGNPGHLELLIRQARRRGEPDAIPLDILALADDRVAELSQDALYALQAIAVMAVDCTITHVAALTGLSGYHLLTALHEIETASLITITAEGIRCRTSFIAERLTQTTSPVSLRLMHERAASLLEGNSTDSLMAQSLAWRIATHWQKAGQRPRALTCLRACWQQAVDIGQPMIACVAIREALRTAVSAGEQAALLDDLIAALQAAGEANAVRLAVAERRRLSDRVQDTRWRRAALAFDEEESRLLALGSAAEHVPVLRLHLLSDTLDVPRRLRAARMLLGAADVALNVSLAQETFTACSTLKVEEPLAEFLLDQTSLIYHTVFGNRDDALRAAERLESAPLSRTRSWYSFVARHNCSLARQLVGESQAPYDRLERDYEECIDASMTVSALKTASLIASVLIGDGFLEQASVWTRRAHKLLETVRDFAPPVDLLSAEVDLALIKGDWVTAKSVGARMQRFASVYGVGRLKNDLALYRLRITQMCDGVRASTADLSELLRYHHIARAFGQHDDHMDVLWVALRDNGRADEATQLLKEYLTVHRRERRPCRFFLRMRTSADPIWNGDGNPVLDPPGTVMIDVATRRFHSKFTVPRDG